MRLGGCLRHIPSCKQHSQYHCCTGPLLVSTWDHTCRPIPASFVLTDCKTANITFCTLHSCQSAYLRSVLRAMHSWHSQTLICSPLHLSTLYLMPIVSALQPIKSGTPSLQLSELVPVLMPSVITSRPNISGRPPTPSNAFFLAHPIQLFCWLLCMFLNDIYLLTDLPHVCNKNTPKTWTRRWQSAVSCV